MPSIQIRPDDAIGYFGDARLATLGADLLRALTDKRTVVLKRLGGTRAQEVRFNRFLNNKEVTHQEMLETEGQRVGACVKGRDVLAIQDTTEINFSSHARSKKGFGTVGNGEDIGLFLHPQLVVDAAHGGVLGLAGCTILNRRRRIKTPAKKRLPQERESRRWLDGMNHVSDVLKDAASITMVADRESDIYEAFAARPDNVHLLTRAAQNRCLVSGDTLFDALRKERVASRTTIDVPQKTKRPARQAEVALRYGVVEVRRPKTSRKTCDAPSVTLHAVFVEEINPPRGEKPIGWMLLTTHAVHTVNDAKRIVAMYRLRWIIEELNRAMKSQGMDMEESQITRAHAMKKLCVMALIAAVRTIQLVRARDGLSQQKLSDGFDNADLPFLKKTNKKMEGKTDKQKNPHRCGSLAWAAWIIGRLGGWNSYYKPPGPKIMHRGLIRFDSMKEGWLLANQAKNV
jgi:Transposase DDE domain